MPLQKSQQPPEIIKRNLRSGYMCGFSHVIIIVQKSQASVEAEQGARTQRDCFMHGSQPGHAHSKGLVRTVWMNGRVLLGPETVSSLLHPSSEHTRKKDKGAEGGQHVTAGATKG